MIIKFEDRMPIISESAFVAPNSTLIGDVTVSDHCFISFGVVCRADVNRIFIGQNCCIQDNAVMHAVLDQIVIGDESIIGYGSIIHGGKIGKNVFIGAGSIILEGVEIGMRSVIAAGSILIHNMKIPSKSLVMGAPAKVIREVTDSENNLYNESGLNLYQILRQEYKNQIKEL